MYVRHMCVDFMRLGVWPFVGLFCLLRGCVALENGLISFGLHCFLRLAHAVYCLPGLCRFLRVIHDFAIDADMASG